MAETTTKTTTCLYCGKPYPIGSAHCPHCEAPAHSRPRDRLRRFKWFFLLLILACAVLILWLPR